MRLLVLIVLCAVACAKAEIVNPPVERVLTDEFDRKVESRIVGVSADQVEIIRSADGARFSVPLATLSESDRVFAADLLRKAGESRSLADTPFITAVLREFQVFDPIKRRLVPVAAETYASTRIFVIGLQNLYDPARAYAVGSVGVSGIPDQAPVLWISTTDEPSLFELVAGKIPQGHATLGFKKQLELMAEGRRAYREYWDISNGSSSAPDRKRPTPISQEKARADFLSKLDALAPPYWPNFRWQFDPETRAASSFSLPRFYALRRDGTPVKFRGVPLAGSHVVVMTALRDNAAELE
jgi:hypothetical protein